MSSDFRKEYKNSNIKFSIIIPCYNVEKYIKSCLDSVITQTFQDIDVICVNDGSTDNTFNILNEYAQKDNRIKIINKENGGLSSARNEGMKYATGDYIYFLDSDDFIEKDLFENAYNAFQNNDIDYYCFGSEAFAENNISQDILSINEYLKIKFNGIQKKQFDIGLNQNIHVWNKIFKKDILHKYKIDFIDNLLYEDIFFTWAYFFLTQNIYFEPKIFHHYRLHNESIMERTTKKKSYKFAVSHLLNWFELFQFMQQDKHLFIKNYKNLLFLLDNYRKRAIEMVEKSDIQLVNHQADLYKKELKKTLKKNYGFLKFIIFNQNLFWIQTGYQRETICFCGIKLKIKYKNMSLKRFLQYIFSVKNDKTHKCFTILFITLKLKKTLFYKLKYLNTPINPRKIVFCNFMGRSYGCNPKYITEEILRQKLPYDIVWLVRNDTPEIRKEYPPQIKLVEYNSKKALEELFTAKLWIDNTRRPSLYQRGLYKKKNQVYIQTWHGSLGIKKVEASVEGLSKSYKKYAKQDSKYIDYILSNSLYDEYMFGQDFWYKGKIPRVGHPRCDIFFSPIEEQNKIREKVKKSLGINDTQKIILYVPSFRDNYCLNVYNIDIVQILESIHQKFGGEWIFAIRLHPNLSTKAQGIFNYNKLIKNATLYPDVLELLLVADIVITDYSSCIFDFMFTRKPAFIYASDIEKYNTDRGFYFPLEDSPFSIAQNNNQLKQNILAFDSKNYVEKINNFLKKQECIEDGCSSKRTVELIKNIMENK